MGGPTTSTPLPPSLLPRGLVGRKGEERKLAFPCLLHKRRCHGRSRTLRSQCGYPTLFGRCVFVLFSVFLSSVSKRVLVINLDMCWFIIRALWILVFVKDTCLGESSFGYQDNRGEWNFIVCSGCVVLVSEVVECCCTCRISAISF